MANFEAAGLTFSDDQTPTPAPALESAPPQPQAKGLTFAPEDNSPQTVFDDTRGKTYEVPQGLNGRAIDQQIGVTQEKRHKADYFGLVDLGKGFAQNATESIPMAMAQAVIESGEVAQQFSLRDLGEKVPLFKDVPLVNPIEGPASSAFRLGVNLSQLGSNDVQSLADLQVETGQRMASGIKSFVDRAGFVPTNPDSAFSKFMFDMGSGSASVATSVGLMYATKRPELVGALFGLQQKGSIYEEGRKSGLTPMAASGVSSVAGGIEGGIEMLGAFAFLNAAKIGNRFGVMFARAGEQALEEMSQMAGEIIVTNKAGIRDTTLMEAAQQIGYAGLLGFLLGVPAGGISAQAEHMGVKKMLRETGMSEKNIDAFINTTAIKAFETGEAQTEIKRMIKDELSDESATEADRINGLREINKAYDEIEANLQVEFAKELGAGELKTKLNETMAREDARIQTRIDSVVTTTEDTELKGRANELMKNSDNLLSELDSLEAKKSDIESKGKPTAAIEKRINSLLQAHDKIDAELSDMLDTKDALKTKVEQRRAGVRADLLARRAEDIVKELDTLEDVQRQMKGVEEKADSKMLGKINARVEALAKQYDAIDEELANLLIDKDLGTIKPSDLLSLKAHDMQMITNKLGKTMEYVRERLQKTMDSMESKIDKSFERLSIKVATLARRNEKKRIHESLKLLRQIRTAGIKNITLQERRMIEKLQAELKEVRGAPSIETLRSFNDRIQLIKEEGKRKLGEIMEQRKARQDAQKELLLFALGTVPGAEKEQKTFVTSQVGKEPIKEKVHQAKMLERATNLSPVRLLEMIDGVNDGIWKQLFFKQVNLVINSKLEQVHLGNDRGVDILKSNGIGLDELGTQVKFDGFDKAFTMSEIMHFYAAMGNDLNLLALIEDNGIPLQVLESAVASLPEKFRKAADQLVIEMSSHAPRLNLAVLNYSDGKEDLPLVSGTRVPMNRVMDPDGELSTPQDDIMESFQAQEDYRQKYVWQGLRRQRVNRGENVKLKPIRTGLVEIYFKEVQNREHFIAAARAVKDLNALLSNKEISSALVDKFGPAVKASLQGYVNRVAADAIVGKAQDLVTRKINDIARSSRQAASFVHLGYNVVSALKAPVSMAAALGFVSPTHLMGGIYKAMRHPKTTFEFAYANDPQLVEAEFSREQQEFHDPVKAVGDKSKITKVRKAIPRHAFDMMRATDQFTRIAIWTGAYDQMMDLAAKGANISEADAMAFAQEIVLKTQPATRAKDVSALFATNNEVLNMFLQFTHQLNQNYGILTHDMPMNWKGGRKRVAVGMGVGLVLNALLEYAISTGHMPTEPEEWTEAQVQGFLMMIPGIGPMLNSLHNGFAGLPPAIDLTVMKPGKMVMDLAEGDFTGALDNAFYLTAAFGKLPYTQLRRSLMGAKDISEGYDDDYRRLIWSEYQLSQEYKFGG